MSEISNAQGVGALLAVAFSLLCLMQACHAARSLDRTATAMERIATAMEHTDTPAARGERAGG